jgi:cytochrome P450
MAPYNPVLGHLLQAKKAFDQLPERAHSTYMMAKLCEQYAPNGIVYFDAWPMFEPIMIISDPLIAHQVTSHATSSQLKPRGLLDWFFPITGGPSLFDTNGAEWNYLHKMFAPSFSNANIVSHVPIMVSSIEIFLGRLRERAASGEKFVLESLCLDLIIDIIGEVLLNIRMDTQIRSHPLADAMKHQLKLKFTNYKPENLLAPVDLVLRFRTWRNGRTLDNLIKDQLYERLRIIKAAKANGDEAESVGHSVIDLAIQDYLSRSGNKSDTTLDPEFLTMAQRNMRMFFFAGYDSSGATIAYCLYNLYRFPETLARLRAEHDSVFGADLSTVTAQILASPAILNSLPYTQAVIKESLRLFPPANGIRYGSRDLVLKDAKGNTHPTEGFGLQMLHWAIQRHENYWPRPDEFLPERWLVEPGHELYPPKGGFRVFEWGARLCIGQQLVMTEVKAILACIVREFNFTTCYDELDVGGKKLNLGGVGGQRVYLVEAGAAHPVDGVPCRVSSTSKYLPKATTKANEEVNGRQRK